MASNSLRLALWISLGLFASAACGSDPWNGARIMPRSDQVGLRVDCEETGGAYQIEWPATVARRGAMALDRQRRRVSCARGVRLDQQGRRADAQRSARLLHADAEDLRRAVASLAYRHLLGKQQRVGVRTRRVSRLPGASARCARPGGAERGATESPTAGRGNAAGALSAASPRSADEAVTAASLLLGLAQTAEQAGMHRPELLFDQADILRKAYRRSVTDERQNDQRD